MRTFALMLVLGLAAIASSAAFAKPSANTLVGTVGPGFTISLKQGAKLVKTLHPGSYTITINDKASIHDFHLTGPGLNKATTVPGTGTSTWKVVLKKGKYHYQCDPHASGMNGNFTVA